MLQELLSIEIAPIGSTHYNACRHSSMNAQRWLPLPGAMLNPCLRGAFGTSSFQVLSEVKPLNSAAAEELSAPVFEPTISTHDSLVSHDFSST